MMDRIAHRGPDSSGTFQDDYINLGFRRLSIIDLSDAGNQPMFNEDGTVAVVFNGEIYNYLELRQILIDKGHSFCANADTEVLIHLYEEFGSGMTDYLRGMFAFVIYDQKTGEVFGARDHFGIKPFYYAIIDENLVFASEIKSILEYPDYAKEVNELALENYLTFQYSVLTETFFKNIFRLYPSHSFVFKDGKINIKRYFEPKFNETPTSMAEAAEAIDAAVKESVKAHKISDVEVGSFLSSGVDSSYVAATFNGDKTFTVGFDYDNYNEIEYAKNLSNAINIESNAKTITTEEYWEAFPKVQYHMDEPLADPSAVALYFVAQLASRSVKVCLSGEGADEFFGGYNVYKEPADIRFLTRLPRPLRAFLGWLGKLIPFKIKGKNLLIRASQDLEERFIGNAKIFSKEEREDLLLRPQKKYAPRDLTKPYYDRVKSCEDVTKMQYIDIHFWLLGDILLKADKMSMAHSLEVRVPFLDKEVFKTAAALPSRLKVGKKGTKLAFREAAKNHLPEEVYAKKKLGFPVPIRIWLKEEKYYNKVKEAFLSESAAKYFHTEKLTRLLERHRAGKEDASRKIWTVYTCLGWLGDSFVY
jgi:asparagine synthase (glutamine-hydrolysing)